MPGYAEAIQEAARQNQTVDLDFSSIGPDDAEEAINAIDLVHSGDAAQQIRRMKSLGKKQFTIDFSQLPRSPSRLNPPETHHVREAVDWLFSPVKALEQAPVLPWKRGQPEATTLGDVTGAFGQLADEDVNAIRTIFPPAPPVMAQTSTVPPPIPFGGTPIGPVGPSGAGFTGSVPETAPEAFPFEPTAAGQRQAEIERSNSRTPLEVAASLPAILAQTTLQQQMSPFGIATTPLPAMGSPLAGVAKLTGKALQPLSEAVLQPVASAIGETWLGSKLMRPAALSALDYTMRRKIMSDTAEIVEDLGPRLMTELTPQESQAAFMALERAAQEREVQLGAWKLQAERAAKGREADRIRAQSLKEFSLSLPEDVNSSISREAKRLGFKGLPGHAKALAEEITQRFGELQDKFVAAKAAGDETFASFDRVYLPRFYLNKEIPLEKNMAAMTQTPRVMGQRFKGRTKTTEQAIQSEVMQDVRLPAIKGLLQESYDADVAEYFHGISLDGSLASPMPRGPAWELLTDSKKYGALHGMYVHPAVAGEIKSLYRVKSGMDKLVDSMASFWKKSVTVFNPPVIAGNVVSSAIQNDLGGLSPFEMGVYREAAREFSSKGPSWRRARALAVVGGDELRTVETSDLLREAFRAYADNHEGVSAAAELSSRLMLSPKASRWTPGTLYRNIEDFMKFSLFHKANTRGIPEWGIEAGDEIAAARHALHFGLDYMDVPLGIREVRSGLPALTIGAPFITYTWKITPLLLEGMLKQPQKFAKYIIGYDAWNRAAFHAMGMTQDQFNEWRSLRSQDQTGPFAGMFKALNELNPYLVLPRRDALGSPMVIGIGRFTPWGQVFQPRGLNPLGLGPGVAATLGAFGMSPTGANLFDINAGRGNAPVPLSPSIGTRRVAAAVKPFIPPLLSRSILAGAEAAGPKFDVLRGATNTPGYIQELLGQTGGMRSGGVPLGLPQQLVGALIGNVGAMNLPETRRQAQRQKISATRSAQEQLAADAFRRLLGQTARQQAGP